MEVEFVGVLGGEEFVEGGVVEGDAGLGFLFLLGFELVAEGHELVDFGDDAFLFFEGW